MNEFLYQIYRQSLNLCDARRLVEEALSSNPPGSHCHFLAIGKAAVPMAIAARRYCSGDGFLLTKHAHLDEQARTLLTDCKLREAGHPVPDADGLAATSELLDWLERHDQELLVLLSGGASSLLVQPAPPLELDDLSLLNRKLLASGLPIESMNVVRKHLSRVKGGQLGERLARRFPKIRQLVMGDVCAPGGKQEILSLIGSGPTVPDPSTAAQAEALLDALELGPRFREALVETPSQLELEAEILADHHTLAATARKLLQEHHLESPHDWLETVQGEVKQLARDWADLARRLQGLGRQGVLVASGEPTVQLTNPQGKGGRCQELALRFAQEIEGLDGVSLLAGSSDGTDGPTEYAGAQVDGHSWQALQKVHGEETLNQLLLSHNSTGALEGVPGLLLRTGPTGQNLNDLFLLQVHCF